MDEDYNQMKSQWKTVVGTIRKQKAQIETLEKKVALLSKSEVRSLSFRFRVYLSLSCLAFVCLVCCCCCCCCCCG